MPLPEKREDSLLFSLRELRTIEADRVRDEEAAQAARAAAEVAARQAELERVIEQQEQRARDLQAAEAARLAEAEQQARESALRLEEAERRARIEGQMRLEEARMRMEIEATAAHGARRKPVGLIVIAVTLFVAVAGLGVFAYQKMQANERAEQDRLAVVAQMQRESAVYQQRIDELNRANAELDQQIDAQVKAMTEAKTTEEAKAHAEAIKGLQGTKAENGRKARAIAHEKAQHDAKGPDIGGLVICPKDKPLCNHE
jgi:hypothetical protein